MCIRDSILHLTNLKKKTELNDRFTEDFQQIKDVYKRQHLLTLSFTQTSRSANIDILQLI